ncbi:LysR family transcriptional regulator [Streptomyces sp. NBC_01231]|nr:LysR family transcriptional regulator [Streptomyces sp. NBC_01231]
MQLDLNLLTVLDALLEEGSVMGAAERLHLVLRVPTESPVDTDEITAC